MSFVEKMAMNLTVTTFTNADFQAFGSFIADAFQAGGFERTADTGQINWSSVAYPGVNDTVAGYELRGFTDALQATAPIYVKLNWRRGSAANWIDVGISVGTGTDGTGGLTGVRMTEVFFSLTQLSAAFPNWLMRASGVAAEGRVVAAGYNVTISSGNFWLGFERTADAGQVLNSRGIAILHSVGSTGTLRVITRSGSAPPVDIIGTSSGNSLTPNLGTFATSAGGTNALTVHPHDVGGGVFEPLRNIILGHSANFGVLSAHHLVDHQGQVANFVVPPLASSPNLAWGGLSTADTRWLMRAD